MERNYWGIDVTIYAPQAEKEANEDGLCSYTKGDINTFGNSQRQEYLVQSQFGLDFCWWLVMDIYLEAKRLDKYPPLATNTEVNYFLVNTERVRY